MKVSKFGGSSVANASQIKKVSEIIMSDPDRRLVVVSAPGKRGAEDVKVTDLLINLASACIAGADVSREEKALLERFNGICEELGLGAEVMKGIEDDIKSRIKIYGEISDERFTDMMKAAGEDNNAKLIAAYMKSCGAHAQYVNPKEAGMFLSEEYGNARILDESYQHLAALRDKRGVSVFPGFFGYSKNGGVVTFPRGGSDITGAILAKAVNADLYENFTDVDSIFVASPKIIDNPKPLQSLTYREMRELSYAGFSVFHEEALDPVFHSGIDVNIKNTNNPQAPGTLISLKRDIRQTPIAGIAGGCGFCCVYLSKYMMNREVGFGRKLLEILEQEDISYEHMPSGIDDISIIIEENQLEGEREAHVLERINKELRVDSLSIQKGLSMIMVVGEGMKHTIGLAERATKALSRAGVNIEMINQGASEVSMMFGILEEDEEKAVKELYTEFFGN